MDFEITKYITGQRPNVELPSTKMYRILGEEGIRKLISDHYDCLKKSEISKLFPEDDNGFEKAKKNAADFFVQICGGPMYFNKNRGRPMMYKRHLPHKITPEARVTWLECFKQALQKTDLPDNVKQSFWNYINNFSIWMINS
jgi:hemoglobin